MTEKASLALLRVSFFFRFVYVNIWVKKLGYTHHKTQAEISTVTKFVKVISVSSHVGKLVLHSFQSKTFISYLLEKMKMHLSVLCTTAVLLSRYRDPSWAK